MNDLIPNVGAGALLERTLLADDRAVRIGAIQTLDYSRAVVITHDKWKEAVGGIPQYAFLLATARETGGGDDDEVLLLRVEGTASLSLERDLQAVREESLRDALSRRQDPSPSVILDVNLDPFTRNRVSFTGLDCRIIGTFYEDGRDGTVVLEFGHDVDNFYATATYRVFKPIGEGLSAIASYIKPTDDPVEMVRVGAIRYSSTRRRTMIAKQDDIPVEVNVYDFIGNKTGMFGMTRMGKSNTMKTVAARVFAVSERRRAAALPPVGQLILDPQGEYANPNLQDGTELAAIGPQHVVIYKFGTGGNQANVRPTRWGQGPLHLVTRPASPPQPSRNRCARAPVAVRPLRGLSRRVRPRGRAWPDHHRDRQRSRGQLGDRRRVDQAWHEQAVRARRSVHGGPLKSVIDPAGAGEEHVGARVDPERDAASGRTCGGQPASLLGRRIEPRSVPAIFDVGGHGHVDRRDDPRDHRRGAFGVQAGAVRYAEGPGHAGTGGGDRLGAGAGDRYRRGNVPRVRQQQRLTRLVQAGEGSSALCLVHSHDRHAGEPAWSRG